MLPRHITHTVLLRNLGAFIYCGKPKHDICCRNTIHWTIALSCQYIHSRPCRTDIVCSLSIGAIYRLCRSSLAHSYDRQTAQQSIDCCAVCRQYLPRVQSIERTKYFLRSRWIFHRINIILGLALL